MFWNRKASLDDPTTAQASLEKLKSLDIRTVYPGHGKPFSMEELLDSSGVKKYYQDGSNRAQIEVDRVTIQLSHILIDMVHPGWLKTHQAGAKQIRSGFHTVYLITCNPLSLW